MNDNHMICDASTGHMPGLVIPEFATKRQEVHWKVRHLNLSAFDRETRQAAAADPSVIWDASARQYRLRRRGDPPRGARTDQYLGSAGAANAQPHPSPATSGGIEGGRGSQKVLDPQLSRPALANGVTSNTQIAQELYDD